jgi:hypothetical protein
MSAFHPTSLMMKTISDWLSAYWAEVAKIKNGDGGFRFEHLSLLARPY